MMQASEDHGKGPRRFPPWVIVVSAAALVAVVLIVVQVVGSPSKSPSSASSSNGHGRATEASHSVSPLYVTATNPLSKAMNVPSNTTISVTFSSPISLHGVLPTLTPDVGGTWVQSSPSTLTYNLNGPLIPGTTELITIPGGAAGVRSTDHGALLSAASFTFTVAQGDVNRLQQLLADLNYLPVSFTQSGSAPSPVDEAMPQPGSFAWRWPGLPTELTSQWTQGSMNQITKAAIETFESDNGLGVDGIAGPAVWTALLNDTVTNKATTQPYIYVLVNKVQPETLTLYDNGAVQFSNILVNTGAPGADTQDGTFVVFEHVTSSEMKGTNPDGSTYDDPDVPWASYFNGGDALHGFVRAHYGFPQSNGCVEMPVATAGQIWPYTPIGTLVTIEGPSSGPGPTTTTTAPPPPATTTTAPPPPATTTTVAG
jgi:peptidoglycan hydrolase-like protein with peptidoglycan-binding domain